MADGERTGVLVTIGRNGWTVFKPNTHDETGRVTRTERVSGYGDGWDKYISPGTPIVDGRTIPDDKLLKWVMQQPLVDPDLKGDTGAKVEHSLGGMDDDPSFPMVASGLLHPTYKAILAYGNCSKCSVEDYVRLAREWGATVTYYSGWKAK